MCGLHNELIQRQLLSEPELTLAKVTEIALAMEAVAKDTLKLQGGKESEVNKITHVYLFRYFLTLLFHLGPPLWLTFLFSPMLT